MKNSNDQPDAPGTAEEYCPYCMSRVVPGQSCPVCKLTEGSYEPLPHHLPPGTVLGGRYLVGRALGEGGFGITYIGRDLRLEMKVAIKEYFPSDSVSRISSVSLKVLTHVGSALANYEKGLKRFLTEARTMARMEKQPQIVMVRDFFEANNTAYIVMEYVEGTNFIELTRQRGGRIEPGELFRLMEPLFPALKAVHSAGLIHRDISPDNLMLEHGVVRLLDFGCSRESSRGTETMSTAIKQGYSPIEQYQRKGQGPWTDVYALSATMYFCLTGTVPPNSLDRLLEDDLVPPRDLGVDITPEQQKALLRGMAIQPRQRYQSVEELHAGLYQTVTPETETLDALMARCGGKVPVSQLLNAARGVFDELGSMHEHARLHLGISPGALELKDGRLMLAAAESAADAAMPEQGFAAPEQYRLQNDRGAWTDVYSLAATLYYALTGSTPPDARRREKGEQLAPASVLGADTQPWQDEALERALEPDPAKRTQSVSELLRELSYPRPAAPEHKRRGLYIAAAAAAAAIVLILALVLIPQRGTQPPVDPPLVTADPQTLPDFDALFSSAVTVSDGEALAAALTDDGVTAVICSGYVDADAVTLELTKPVYVAADGSLTARGTLIAAEGCTLWIDGELGGSEGCAVLTQGGDIIAGESAAVHAPLWYSPGSLTMLCDREALGVVHSLPSEAVFEFARTVTDYASLAAAAEDGTVTAIVIDGAITLENPVSTGKPILITERGSVALPEGSAVNEAEPFALSVEGGLINYGSITCGLWYDGGTLLNCGTLAPAGGLWAGERDSAERSSFANLGEVVLPYYSAVWCDTLNLGSISVTGESAFLGTEGAGIFNYGTLSVGGGSVQLSGSVVNCGDIAIDGGMFENLSLMRQRGAISVGAGTFENLGFVEMYDGGSVRAGEDGEYNTENGVTLTRDAGSVAGNITGSVWTADFQPIDDPESTHRAVTTEAELLSALEDNGVDCVDIATGIDLTDSLAITKPVYVLGEGALNLPDGEALIVDGTVAAINGLGVTAQQIIVQNGGMLEIIADWHSEGASLTVTGGSWFFSRGSSLALTSCSVGADSMAVYDLDGEQPAQLISANVDGGALVLASAASEYCNYSVTGGGLILQLAALEAQGGINVDDGRYSQNARLTLGGGASTGELGEFCAASSILTIEPEAAFENAGRFTQNSFTDRTIFVHGRFINTGEVYLTGEGAVVSGEFENSGALYGWDTSDVIVLDGAGRFTGAAAVSGN